MHERTDHPTEVAAEAIAVVRVDGHHGLVATRRFGVGDLILILEGEVVDRPSRFSVQIGPNRHVEVPAEVKLAGSLDRYRWRFLNHSCEPNAAFDDRRLVALRRIEGAEQITFDYNTTEYDLASPFECHCGSPDCCGVVRGSRWTEGRASAEG